MKDRKLLNIELGRISADEYKDLPPSGLVVVLDNIRSAHNVGSAFRTADSFGTFRREPGRKYALIFGNEVSGVRQDVVDASDFSLEIPQFGTKHSLNVSVSVGVVLWEMVRR